MLCRFDEHIPTTSEFAAEQDQLFLWLEETEKILAEPCRPMEEDSMEERLGKIKVKLRYIKANVSIVHTLNDTENILAETCRPNSGRGFRGGKAQQI